MYKVGESQAFPSKRCMSVDPKVLAFCAESQYEKEGLRQVLLSQGRGGVGWERSCHGVMLASLVKVSVEEISWDGPPGNLMGQAVVQVAGHRTSDGQIHARVPMEGD